MAEFRQPFASMLAPLGGSITHGERAGVSAPAATAGTPRSLKILHILRAPLGGLFRHVVDVVRGQAERGHRVGLIVDSSTGGERAEEALAKLAPHLALGLKRIAITRQLSIADIASLQVAGRHIATMAPDVLHGHGAKGAALARLVPRTNGAIRAYTPHGGSLVYAPGTLAGGFYRFLERALNRRTDLFLFESGYIADEFQNRIGSPQGLVRVVRNGVSEAEFGPVTPRPDATDLVSVGELRGVKAFDVLIAAIAMLRQSGRRVTATIAGDGPEGEQLAALTHQAGVADQIRFVGHQPAREAFAMGRILAVPSRAESLPYIVLEAAAAGMPIIATRVGGIPEIFGREASHLFPADNVTALADATAAALDDPENLCGVARAVQATVRREFSIKTMVDGGLTAYREAIAMHKVAQLT